MSSAHIVGKTHLEAFGDSELRDSVWKCPGGTDLRVRHGAREVHRKFASPHAVVNQCLLTSIKMQGLRQNSGLREGYPQILSKGRRVALYSHRNDAWRAVPGYI